ncbi:MAG TPA: DNRLRE domain-containing protein [Patescibacteria group bacterium]|nr:DNRLRE domain-containing protein [Patescibacteria group bacterium]
MPQAAHGQLPATPPRPHRNLGRLVRLGLIGLIALPFILTEQLGLVASTASITVAADADAQVRSYFPDRNYGDGIRLRSRAKASDNQRTLLRFTLPKLPGKVKSVQLRLFVRDRSNKGGEVHLVTGSWSESKVTWTNRPTIDSSVVGRIGATGRPGGWVSVPLRLDGLKSGKKINLAIIGASTNGAWYASRETGKGPRLVLTLAAAGNPPPPNPNPTAKPDPTATPDPTPTPDPNGTPGPTATPTAAPTATATPAPTATATPAPTSAPPGGVRTPAVGILVGRAELAALPTSGAAWTNLKSWADGAAGTPDIQNQDEDTDIHVLAKGLVYARTGIASYRSGALAILKSAVGSESGGRTLAAARNLPGYVIAADLIDLNDYDPSFDMNTFRPWLRRLLTESLSGDTIISTHEDRPNNWGTHAGAARAAIARYLGDSGQLARTSQIFHGWLGDRASYAGFKYGDLSWQCDSTKPVGINPTGCSKSGHVLDGALPDDMRRGGGFQWPPASTGYPWEAMQGVLLQALILDRAGYDTFAWNNRAILRAANFLYDKAGWAPSSDDTWQPWILNHFYGTNRPTSAAHAGKNMSFTDWLFPN